MPVILLDARWRLLDRGEQCADAATVELPGPLPDFKQCVAAVGISQAALQLASSAQSPKVKFLAASLARPAGARRCVCSSAHA